MQRTRWLHLFLLGMVFFHDQRLVVSAGEPTVSAWIITPEADRKEGKRVDLRCVATNLNSSHIVEWRTEDPVVILRWGTSTRATSSTFRFETIRTNGTTTQEFTITYVVRGDTNEYICSVHEIFSSGGSRIVVTASVQLSVLFFPEEHFPICSHPGAITVDYGTELNLLCKSTDGNLAIDVKIHESSTKCENYSWLMLTANDCIVMSLDLIVSNADNDTTFKCTISSMYYPGIARSCVIGPIVVINATESPATSCVTTTPSHSNPDSSQTMVDPDATTPTPSAFNVAIIAGTSAGGVAAFVLILALVIICRKRGVLSANSTLAKYDSDLKLMPSISQQASDVVTRRNDGFGASVNPDAASVTGPRCSKDSGNSGIEIRTPIKEKSHDDCTKLRVTPPSTAAETKYQSFDATQQKYSNPVFDSTDPDSTSEPSGLTPITALKLIAKVPPTVKVPKKPEPYKPKAQRASKHNEVTDDLQERRSQTLTPPPPSPLATPNNDEVSYAQISVPSKQEQKRPCQEPFLNQPSSDNMVYADLDLK